MPEDENKNFRNPVPEIDTINAHMKNFLSKFFIFLLLVGVFLGFFSLVYELFLKSRSQASTEWIHQVLVQADFAGIDSGVFKEAGIIETLPESGRQAVQEFLKMDLNRATREELETLPRIGPKMADRIIEYRNQHGFFSKISDLEKVQGLGLKTIEKIKPFVKVETPRMSFLKKKQT